MAGNSEKKSPTNVLKLIAQALANKERRKPHTDATLTKRLNRRKGDKE